MSAIEKALAAARKKCLSEDEAYWLQDPDYTRPISARNEAAALSWMLEHKTVVCRGDEATEKALDAACASYCERVAAAGSAPSANSSAATSTSGRPFDAATTEQALMKWSEARGMQGNTAPALFDTPAGPLRGLMAGSQDVAAGDVVLSWPQDQLITYETAKQSDLGKMLARLPLGLSDDMVALIWTCVERHEPESTWAVYWAALPAAYHTGLSATGQALAAFKGTPLHDEALTAQKHLREQFDAAAPVFATLLAAYPDYFQTAWFSWESFLWAAELWYAYGIQVQLLDGTLATCLAPVVGLANHSPLPHIVHFSRVDATSRCLRLRCFRPCAAGQQLYLSYGPYPNGRLLLFYGFAVDGNPFDEAPITFKIPASDKLASQRKSALSSAGLGLEHRLRPYGPLAPTLLATARVLAATAEELSAMSKAAREAASGGKKAAEGGADPVQQAALSTLLLAMSEATDVKAHQLVAAQVAAAQQALTDAESAAASKAKPDADADAAAHGPLMHFVGVYKSGLRAIYQHAQRLCELRVGGSGSGNGAGATSDS